MQLSEPVTTAIIVHLKVDALAMKLCLDQVEGELERRAQNVTHWMITRRANNNVGVTSLPSDRA